MPPVFRILGPLEVELSDGRVLALGRRERALLAVLLLNAGEVVAVERLIDGVWGEAPPSSAKHMVHEYVSRLRTALGDASRIQTRVPGYFFTCDDDELDARVFGDHAAAARTARGAGDHATALRAYEHALGLWRGDALAGVEVEGTAQIDAARLDEERLQVVEERVDSALALGRHQELLPELERRVRDEPLRERPRAQLMLALYRAGRQIDALERYRDGRALLVDHAGVEPGPELRGLERAILTQDPALDLALPARADKQALAAKPARRRWTRVGGAGALLVAVVATAIVVASRSDSAHALARIDASSAGAIDPASNRLVKQVRVGTGPGRVAAGFGSLWVVNDFDSTISRIDPNSGTVQQTIQVDGDPTAIAAGAGFVWVACTGTRSVDRIDPQADKRTQSVVVGNGPSGIAITPGAVWVTNRLDDTVSELDSKSGKVRRTISAGPSPSDIAYGFGALWIANESSSSVTRLNPSSGALQEVPVGNGPQAVAVGYGSIWVANGIDGTVSRINPGSDVVTSFTVGAGPSSILASAGAIWVADSYGGRIDRVDPATNAVVRTIAVGNGPQDIASIGGRIWLSARATASVHRGGTLRLFDWRETDSLDVGAGYSPTSWSLFADTGDGLVGFKRVGGLDGGTLVPDLATSLPKPTDGGRTYTFQLRRGIHYSNGDLVRASDLRRALERVLLFNVGSDLYRGLEGADDCSKTRCDLSRGVVADDRNDTVTVHLRAPDSEFLYKLAIPFADLVPRGVPMTKPARLGVPGTGPYMIHSDAHSRVILVRNPRFRQWSAAAQPPGYPDRIELTLDSHFGKQLTAVEQGKADLMDSLPASRLTEINTRYAAQVHVFGRAQTAAIFLNTREPPFNNLKARQALSYAIDRSKIVAAYGGVEGAAVTCQILPAGMPGYRPYCPFTRNSTASGTWTGPDLARARRLVAASGTRGQRVVLWTRTRPFLAATGREAVAALNRIGYRASLKRVASDDYFFQISDSRNHVQAGFIAWSQDYPAASNFLMLFTCRAFLPGTVDNNNAPELCNRRVDRAVEDALAQQTSDARSASNTSWAAADRMVTDLAAWVPVVNPRDALIVSHRVGNVQATMQWGVLLDQLWVK